MFQIFQKPESVFFPNILSNFDFVKKISMTHKIVILSMLFLFDFVKLYFVKFWFCKMKKRQYLVAHYIFFHIKSTWFCKVAILIKMVRQSFDILTKKQILDEIDKGTNNEVIITKFNLKSHSNISRIKNNRVKILESFNSIDSPL